MGVVFVLTTNKIGPVASCDRSNFGAHETSKSVFTARI